MSRSRQQDADCLGELIAIVTTREQVAIAIKRHNYGPVTEELLDDLGRQFPATPFFGVDAPAGEEVPESVKGVFGLYRASSITPAAAMIGSRLRRTASWWAISPRAVGNTRSAAVMGQATSTPLAPAGA